MVKLVFIKFVRDTLPGEGDVIYKKDEVVSLTEPSANRWMRRMAAELVAEVKKPAPVKKKKVSVKKKSTTKKETK